MNEVVDKLLTWYCSHKRKFPWRKDKDPYHVWISEIMLQQTRTGAVIPYYEKFMTTLPSISSLAKVDDDLLMKLWQGLGYYNRARNLKKAAVMIMEKYDGKFPTTYSEIIQLPGIGEYTASAISSICFGEDEVVVDGNVMRVFTRFYNDSCNISKASCKKKIHDHLQAFSISDFGMFNEALMELGEVVCIPNGMPKCSSCPLKEECLAYQNENYYLFPVKDEKREKEEVFLTVFVFVWNGMPFVQKRKEKGLLHNLYEFPNVSKVLTEKEVWDYGRDYGEVLSVRKSISYTHVFTHKKWKMQSYFIFMGEVNCPNLFSSISDVEDNYALPSAFLPFFYILKEELL